MNKLHVEPARIKLDKTRHFPLYGVSFPYFGFKVFEISPNTCQKSKLYML